MCDAFFFFLLVVVELPDEPDGKRFELFFEREGQVEASTQTTRPITVNVKPPKRTSFRFV